MSASFFQSVIGYVMISMEGLALERVLNDAIKEGVRFENLSRPSRTRFVASMRVVDFYKLKRVARKRKVRIRILAKNSLPLRVFGRKAPKILVWGWIPVLLAVIVSTRFLWFVDIEGCYRVDEQDVIAILEQHDIKRGTPLKALENNSISRAITEADERIASAFVERRGVVLTVTVVEAEMAQTDPVDQPPRSLYAKKDGVIVSITTLEGQAKVSVGGAVKRGDLLITGDLTSEAQREHLVHAKGSVYARVSYQAQAVQKPTAQGLSRSGAWVEYLRISLFGQELFPKWTGFEYWVFERERTSHLNVLLPIEIAAGRLVELSYGEVQLHKEEMEQRALLRAQAALTEQIPEDARMMGKQSKIEYDEHGNCVATVVIQTEEEISEGGPLSR